MSSLRLDSNNNLVVGSILLTVEGNEALSQDIRNKLDLWRGEYPFDLNVGIDYPSLLQQGDKKAIEAAIRNIILEDERVNNVEIEVTQEGGKLILNGKIITNEGGTINV